MSLLIHKLPTEVNKNIINTDFRISILFELLIQDRKVPNDLKILKALELYYPNFETIKNYDQVVKAVEGMLWFYQCGKELANSNKDENNNKYNQIYSYEFDDKYIYSAFMEQYKIDLQEIEYMHWWKFRALFDGLNENTEIVKIMGYRSMDLSKIKDTERRNYYKKMKRLYALPDMRTIEEKETEFARGFLANN